MTLWIITGIIVLAVSAVLIASWRLSNFVVKPKIANPEVCYIEASDRGEFDKNAYEKEWNREDFFLTSPCGYRLACTLIPRESGMEPQDKRERVVVIVHGYSYCKVGSIKYAEMFRELGFNCIIYDHRNHGFSDKAPTTMGYYEAYDLKAVCEWARERFGRDAVIGTHGESMGAATVMMNIPLNDMLAFAIEDCGYSSLPDQLAHSLKLRYHLPRYPFLPVSSLIVRLRGGVGFRKVLPVKAVAKRKDIPVLFIHGEADNYVPFHMVNELYDKKNALNYIKTFPGAEHAQSYLSDKEGYKKAVSEFLKINKII